MQTFLIASSNPSFIEQEIGKISKNLQLAPVNIIDITSENSLTIAQVRMITQTLLLKPYAGGDRMITIRNIEKATPEAGNALLKILEEPPPHNYLVLICSNINKLLATVTSRCQIITDHNKDGGKSVFDSAETKKILQQILSASAGERILLSQKLAGSREEAIQLLHNLLLTLEQLLHKNNSNINLSYKEIAETLGKVSAAKNYLERYINFKATLDVLFLGFPKSRKTGQDDTPKVD